MIQVSKFWADFCRHLDREDMIDDDRWNTPEKLLENAPAAAEIVHEVIGSKPYSHWVDRFRSLEGQWAPVQDTVELGRDPQVRANGLIAEITDVDGTTRELVANPVQFDETPAVLRRAPQFAEHTDDILRDLGLDEERILSLKIDGAVT
jgi:crotonobetainyl-CoA:carnitine CoA-transferase CaiB-like acyl-CoA transferase